MPPIFVDDVEIEEVFVDGVEQETVFVDGVEVFTRLQFMFDDFTGSPNGTPLADHISNTGQGWLPGSLDDGSVIRTSIQGQGMGVSGTAPLAVQMEPQVSPDLGGYEAQIDCNYASSIGLISACRMYMGDQLGGGADNVTWVQYNPISGVLALENNGVILNSVTHPNPGTLFCTLVAWFDGTSMQGRVTTNGQTVTTLKEALTGPITNLRNAEPYVSEAGLLATGSPTVTRFELQEYLPEDVPFP